MRVFAAVALAVMAVVAAACGSSPPPPPAKPPPPRGPLRPAGFDQVTAKCAQIASCAHPHDPLRVRDPSLCVDQWLTARDQPGTNALCLLKAKTCADVDACLHGADARAAQFCARSAGVLSACDENRLVTCASDELRESTAVDCGALGATCTEARVAGGLVVRGCASPKLCPPDAPETRCDGAAVVSCRDGMVERVPCEPGDTCEEHKDEGGESYALCHPRADRRCLDFGASRCDGDRAIECVAGRGGHFGVQKVIDCGKADLTCAVRGSRAACVVREGASCVRGPARCEGDLLVFCAAGAEAKVPCAKLGLGPCDPGARGPEAACGPPL